jgi:hypothetical protein
MLGFRCTEVEGIDDKDELQRVVWERQCHPRNGSAWTSQRPPCPARPWWSRRPVQSPDHAGLATAKKARAFHERRFPAAWGRTVRLREILSRVRFKLLPLVRSPTRRTSPT